MAPFACYPDTLASRGLDVKAFRPHMLPGWTPSLGFARPPGVALPAGTAPVGPDRCVGFIEGVAVLAVGLGSTFGGVSSARPQVLAPRDRSQVARVAAQAMGTRSPAGTGLVFVVAHVVKIKAGRNRANEGLVDHPVRHSLAASPVRPIPHRDPPVAIVRAGLSKPRPARIGATRSIRLSQHSLQQGLRARTETCHVLPPAPVASLDPSSAADTPD